MRGWTGGASAVALLAAAMLGACDRGPQRPPALHQYTLSYDFTISPDQAPPHDV